MKELLKDTKMVRHYIPPEEKELSSQMSHIPSVLTFAKEAQSIGGWERLKINDVCVYLYKDSLG